MSKYLYAYTLSLQNVLQLRATLLMDRIGGVAILATLYFFWSALVPERGTFLGYDRAQMLTYVLMMNLLRSFVFTGRGWNLVQEISSGRISGYLLRPLDYRGYSLALDMAQKTVHLGAALLEVSVLVWLLDVPLYVPARAETWALFAAAAALSSLVFFFLEFAVSSFAFWTSESAGPLFCFELFLQFAAGTFFPLDVLPAALRAALELTPFPYMVFLPIQIYLEKVPAAQAMSVLGVQTFWLAAAMAASGWVWKRGLAVYSAEGG